jgi:hypothetical protein
VVDSLVVTRGLKEDKKTGGTCAASFLIVRELNECTMYEGASARHRGENTCPLTPAAALVRAHRESDSCTAQNTFSKHYSQIYRSDVI